MNVFHHKILPHDKQHIKLSSYQKRDQNNRVKGLKWIKNRDTPAQQKHASAEIHHLQSIFLCLINTYKLNTL